MSPMAKRKYPMSLKQSRVVMAVLRPCPSPLPPPRHRIKSSTSNTLRGVKYKDNSDGGLAARIPRVRVVKRSNLHTFETGDEARFSKHSLRSRENRLASKLVTLVLDESGQSRTADVSAGCQTKGVVYDDADDNGPVLHRPAVALGSPNAECCPTVADAPMTVKYQRVTAYRPFQCGELNIQPGDAGDFPSGVTQCWSSAKVGHSGSTEHCPCCLNSRRDHSTGAVNEPPVLCSGDHLRARSDCSSNNHRSCSGKDDIGTAKFGEPRRTGAARSTGRFHGNDPSVVRKNMVSKDRKCLRSRTSSRVTQSKSPRFISTRSGLVSVSPDLNTLGSDRLNTRFVPAAQTALTDCPRSDDRRKLSRPGPTSPVFVNRTPSPIKEPSVTMNSHSHGRDVPRAASVDISLSPPSPVMRRLEAIGYEPRSIYLQRLINKYSARTFKDRLPTSRTEPFAGERPQGSPKLMRHVLKSQRRRHVGDTAGGRPLSGQTDARRDATESPESPVRLRQRVDEDGGHAVDRSPEYHSGTVRFTTDSSAARHIISSRTSAYGSPRNILSSTDPKATLDKASPTRSIRSEIGKKRFSPISEASEEVDVDRDTSDESSPHKHFHSGVYQRPTEDRQQHLSSDLGRQSLSRKSCLKRTRQKRSRSPMVCMSNKQTKKVDLAAHSSPDPDRPRTQSDSRRQDRSKVAVDADAVNNPSADSLHRSYYKCVHQYYLSPRLFMEPVCNNDEESVTSACRICRATRSIQQPLPQQHRRQDVGERAPPEAGSPAGLQDPEVDDHAVGRRRSSADCSSELVRLTVPEALFSDSSALCCPARQPTRRLSVSAGTTGYTSRHQTATALVGRRVSYRRPQPASFSLRRRIGEIS